MQSALKREQQSGRAPRNPLPSKEEAEQLLRGDGAASSCASSQHSGTGEGAEEAEPPALHWRDALAAANNAETSEALTDTFG